MCDYIRLSSLPAAGEVSRNFRGGSDWRWLFIIIMIIGYQYSCNFNENRCAKTSFREYYHLPFPSFDMLACYRVLTKNTKICTYSVHFSFRNVCPACILAPFLIPDSFVATPHSISCLYTKKKIKLILFVVFDWN